MTITDRQGNLHNRIGRFHPKSQTPSEVLIDGDSDLTVLLRPRNNTVMDSMSVQEVAKHLKVSPQRVRAMLAADLLDGRLVAGRWLVDPSSIPPGNRQPGQPLSARSAWGLAAIAEGSPAGELADSERSRLRARLRVILAEEDVDALRSMMSRRAARSRWSAPDPDGLLHDSRVVRSGRSDLRSGMSAPQFAEVYVRADELDAVVSDHLLVPARGPENVIVRVVSRAIPAPLPALIVAADLADGGAREVQQAQNLLRKLRGT